MISLEDVLGLVGSLDDTPGGDTGRERFRAYLERSVTELGAVRDAIESCLRNRGTQYNRALQDLVNHTGRLMGFEVTFGRYSGVQGEIGYDGIWRTPELVIVVEVKTTDVYSISTATLVGYIDQLISSQQISDWEHALGLYVVGRSAADNQPLVNAIVAEGRIRQLRVASVDAILSLAELVESGDIEREEVVRLLAPSGPLVDDTVDLLARVAAHELPPGPEPKPEPAEPAPPPGAESRETILVMTPVSDDETESAAEIIRNLLGRGIYLLGERTPRRKDLQPGDRICFYQTQVGVVAEATVASSAEKRTVPGVRQSEKHPYVFKVRDPRYFFDNPVVIDAGLRSRLDAFRNRDPDKAWAWFVQATRIVTENDFRLLTDTSEALTG